MAAAASHRCPHPLPPGKAPQPLPEPAASPPSIGVAAPRGIPRAGRCGRCRGEGGRKGGKEGWGSAKGGRSLSWRRQSELWRRRGAAALELELEPGVQGGPSPCPGRMGRRPAGAAAPRAARSAAAAPAGTGGTRRGGEPGPERRRDAKVCPGAPAPAAGGTRPRAGGAPSSAGGRGPAASTARRGAAPGSGGVPGALPHPRRGRHRPHGCAALRGSGSSALPAAAGPQLVRGSAVRAARARAGVVPLAGRARAGLATGRVLLLLPSVIISVIILLLLLLFYLSLRGAPAPPRNPRWGVPKAAGFCLAPRGTRGLPFPV